jgi:hypothetical protein
MRKCWILYKNGKKLRRNHGRNSRKIERHRSDEILLKTPVQKNCFVLEARRRKSSMFLRPRCLTARSFAPLSRSTVFPRSRSVFRNYSSSTKTSPRSVETAPVTPPSPETLRKLRSKESRWRKSLLAGFLAATGVAYYLDGKYNARAIRRTFRTAWVGATLAADYKWNFTYRFPSCLLIVDLRRRIRLRSCISVLQDELWI